MPLTTLAKKSVVAFAFLLASIAAHAQAYTVESGRTTVALSSAFVGALQTLHVTPGTIGPTQLVQGRVDFPAVAGAISVNTAKGEILHSGGITLATQGVRVRLQSFIIDTTGSPMITGLVTVNGQLLGRMPLFNLVLPAGLTLPLKPSSDGALWLKGVGVRLNPNAASALNSVFSVSAFKGGLNIGTANVNVFLREDAAK